MSPFDYLNAVTVGSIGAELATNLEQWLLPLLRADRIRCCDMVRPLQRLQKQPDAQFLERGAA